MHHLNVTALGPAHQLHLNTVEARHRQKSLAHNLLSGGTAKGQAAPPTHLRGPQHRYWSSSKPDMCLWSCACERLKAAQCEQWRTWILGDDSWVQDISERLDTRLTDDRKETEKERHVYRELPPAWNPDHQLQQRSEETPHSPLY